MIEPQTNIGVDSNHPSDTSLNNNDPTSSTKSNTNDERNLIDAFAIRIDLDKLSTPDYLIEMSCDEFL